MTITFADDVAPSVGFKRHILVIDGDDAVLERTRAVLEDAGCEVTLADMPDIGLVRRVRPDAIVLGLIFRGQATGLDFLARHVADPATAAVPVLVQAAPPDVDPVQWSRLVALARPVGKPDRGTSALMTHLRRLLETAPLSRVADSGAT